jgi:hypothetical protein
MNTQEMYQQEQFPVSQLKAVSSFGIISSQSPPYPGKKTTPFLISSNLVPLTASPAHTKVGDANAIREIPLIIVTKHIFVVLALLLAAVLVNFFRRGFSRSLRTPAHAISCFHADFPPLQPSDAKRPGPCQSYECDLTREPNFSWRKYPSVEPSQNARGS